MVRLGYSHPALPQPHHFRRRLPTYLAAGPRLDLRARARCRTNFRRLGMSNPFTTFLLCSTAFSALLWGADASKTPPPPVKPGVKTPGVQQPITVLEPDAVFPVEGVPDWVAIGKDSVWIGNKPKNTVHRLDPSTNKVVTSVEVGKLPCAG